ncbi:stage II sporulation protein R [Salirhabdus euzebyi]|uniref:Stage II sporulation protein R n=1 Tax=Salirhabdus euzebyi TaxID=394506 RepID=A0A841Q6D0_9BACI|nr:stage II sporulation protein R [Salirhabdus euzebyi]MBB6453935.1 stage II sporulation protein R [Salirhabdus euzebyi]
MKKFVFITVVAIILFINPLTGYSSNDQTTNSFQVIPDESIRLRILAHSNSDADQDVKREIRDEVNKEITKWVETLQNIDGARDVIESRLSNIEEIVQDVLQENQIDQSYEVTFGDVQFPSKVYGDNVYPAGVYEAVLITLGDGKGDNWWCVLFPPLCFLDFSNGTSVADADTNGEETELAANENKAEVKFFLVKIFDWITSLFA